MSLDSPIQINILDIDKSKTIGVAFPLDKNNFNQGTTTVREQIKTNLLNLMLTEPGERLYIPEYGIGLKKLLFSQEINLDALNSTINQKIQFYLPEITLIDTETDFVENEHLLYLKIIYRYNFDNSIDAIQLNFNS
jgi:phage baseplate assembly protein W